MNVSVELQKALFKALSSDKYKVFESLPKGDNYPCIQIGEMERTTNNTKTSTRHVYNFYIHTWSEGTSSFDSKVLNQFVDNKVLKSLVLNDLELGIVALRSERTLTEIGVDKNIYHGVLYFEATIIQY